MIDVIIPVYKPDVTLRKLLKRLTGQTLAPDHILIVNTEKQFFEEQYVEGIPNVEVIHISKAEFDHGATRHMAAEHLRGELMLFMTQDAMPADRRLVEKLADCFRDSKTAASYARQLPREDCSILEQYTRSFNYGPESMIKTADDLKKLGIKTFFCSNVCAMYRRSVYEEIGGFPRPAIFNEDMIYAGQLIRKGYAVAYCSEAKVIHSHNYTAVQQFHRNFDLGVSQAEHPEIFQTAKSEKEGIRMIRQTAGYLCRRGKPWLLGKLIYQSGCKYLGYLLGKKYRSLPKKVIIKCTMNPDYWFREDKK